MNDFKFTWNDSFETGYEIIDFHHLKLIELINKLAIAHYLKKEKSVLTEILFELENYAKYHFREEENLINSIGGTPSPEHLKEHKRFIGIIHKLKFDFVSDERPIGIELFNFLKDWLVEHILGIDKEELSISPSL